MPINHLVDLPAEVREGLQRLSSEQQHVGRGRLAAVPEQLQQRGRHAAGYFWELLGGKSGLMGDG